MRDFPTLAEITAIIGHVKWAVCRRTPKNLARYGQCFTRREYAAIQVRALALRAAA